MFIVMTGAHGIGKSTVKNKIQEDFSLAVNKKVHVLSDTGKEHMHKVFETADNAWACIQNAMANNTASKKKVLDFEMSILNDFEKDMESFQKQMDLRHDGDIFIADTCPVRILAYSLIAGLEFLPEGREFIDQVYHCSKRFYSMHPDTRIFVGHNDFWYEDGNDDTRIWNPSYRKSVSFLIQSILSLQGTPFTVFKDNLEALVRQELGR